MEMNDTNKIIQEMDEEDGSEAKRINIASGGNDFRRGICEWPSSRIVRVSKASGGKDRHSKVWTSKGRLRDRRVRLSATTAIQFYDLQDRLGYEQPSKAVDWLLRAAESSISELPTLNNSFLDCTSKQYEMPSSEERNEQEFEVDPSNYVCKNVSLSKFASTSTSDNTSKGSGSGGGLSVWMSENKVPERARGGRDAEEDEKRESKQANLFGAQNVKQTSSFTELLTGNFGSSSINNSPSGSAYGTPMDHYLSGYSEQIQMGNSLEPFSITTTGGEQHYNHQQLHQFSFVPDNNNLVSVATAAATGGGNDNYNLNFSVSSGLASGYNRETLQSNSPSMLPPQLQRFAPFDGSNVPFFLNPKGENNYQHHYQFAAGLDGPLQLFHGDANWHSDQKGKGKN